MKKLNQLAMLVATVALATTAVAQDINNWRNAGGEVWKNFFFDGTATTEIYPRKIVGSVRCV